MTREELAKHFAYLDMLRSSGETNMFGAGSYLREHFGLDRATAQSVLQQWMKSDLTLSAQDRAEKAFP